jgi:hypothetical protein
MDVGRGHTKIMDAYVEVAVTSTPSDHRLIDDVIDHLRQDREHVDSHQDDCSLRSG